MSRIVDPDWQVRKVKSDKTIVRVEIQDEVVHHGPVPSAKKRRKALKKYLNDTNYSGLDNAIGVEPDLDDESI